MYCNRLQLATTDALYSDGDRYTPAVSAVKKLKNFLPGVKRVLVLGAGLGSMVYVLRRKGLTPDVTLVEMDKVVLGMAMELMADDVQGVTPVCSDARIFMMRNEQKFDFIFIDIFMGRTVPDFVVSTDFLQQCRAALTDGGRVAFNYIVNNEPEWGMVRQRFCETFPNCEVVEVSVNRILIG